MVTVVVMLFLIATVIFALSQMLNVSSGNVIDGQRQGNSTAAFYLAESGLERAQASLSDAYSSNINNTSCTGVAATYNLGLGTVALTGVSTPPTCDNDGGTPCTACTVTATGQVGISTRTLTRDLALTITNGTTCNGANTGCGNNPVTWRLRLKNAAAVAGIGIFNLTYIRKGNNQPTCAAGLVCNEQLNLSSPSNGDNSTGLMGNAVLIPAGSTYPIYQTMTKPNNNLAEVGTFFLGTTAPTLTAASPPGAASYWGDKNSSGRTVGANSGVNTGGTTDGTATSSGSCSALTAGNQACTSWCYGGDTLVFSYAANVTALTDELSSVTFGTNASVGQNFPMTRIAKYPTTLVGGAPKNVDAEIWYARNPNFIPTSTPLAANASSYKGRGTGAVGAAWTTANASSTSITLTTLTVGAGFGGYPAQIISEGDTVVSTGVAANTTIVKQLTSTESGGMTSMRGGKGTYEVSISQTVAAANNRLWTVNSNVLNVTACTICYFVQADVVGLSGLSAGRAINLAQTTANTYDRTEAFGGLGRYQISGTATRVASGITLYAGTAAVFAGTPATTLYLPSGSSQPAVTTPAMRIIVKSGTGALAPNTTVTEVNEPTGSVNTRAVTVTPVPTTVLDNASLCAGTCALFIPGAITTFALGGMTVNFNEWASGFTCLKGVNLMPQVVTTTSPANARWIEVVN